MVFGYVTLKLCDVNNFMYIYLREKTKRALTLGIYMCIKLQVDVIYFIYNEKKERG
jgi:hypothetical protein